MLDVHPPHGSVDETRAHAGLPPERPNESFDDYTNTH